MSIDRWMNKEDVVNIYNGILISHKKQWNLAIYNNMDGPRGYYVKWNKSDRGKQIPCDFTCMWNLKNKINKQNRNKLINRETNWWSPHVRGIRGMGEKGERD